MSLKTPEQLEYNKNWCLQNKRRRLSIAGKSRKKARAEALAIMGSKCTRCGFNDDRALQIDHVNGDGAKERREIGWWGIIKEIREGRWQGRYQLLCANCNTIKRIENREFRYGLVVN